MRIPWLLPMSLLWVCLFSAGCGDSSPEASRSGRGRPVGSNTVTLFGAASTTNVLSDLSEAFQRKSGAKVVCNFASSSTLAQQIISGAGADVFLSANVKWADAVDNDGLVAERVDLLGNRLVVIAPADSKLSPQTFDDLKEAPIERLALADPSSAPAGIYAVQALETLGLWPAMEPKIVAGADVRQVLAYVEQGVVEAGIVYATDSAMSDRVKIILEIPPEASATVTYPLVLLRSGDGNAAAESLYAYLQSAEATTVFERHGFALKTKPAGAAR